MWQRKTLGKTYGVDVGIFDKGMVHKSTVDEGTVDIDTFTIVDEGKISKGTVLGDNEGNL